MKKLELKRAGRLQARLVRIEFLLERGSPKKGREKELLAEKKYRKTELDYLAAKFEAAELVSRSG